MDWDKYLPLRQIRSGVETARVPPPAQYLHPQIPEIDDRPGGLTRFRASDNRSSFSELVSLASGKPIGIDDASTALKLWHGSDASPATRAHPQSGLQLRRDQAFSTDPDSPKQDHERTRIADHSHPLGSHHEPSGAETLPEPLLYDPVYPQLNDPRLQSSQHVAIPLELFLVKPCVVLSDRLPLMLISENL